jgi:hypothetical protein
MRRQLLLYHAAAAAAVARAGSPWSHHDSTSCSIRLNRTITGSCSPSGGGRCPGSWSRLHAGCPWGCGGDAGTMFTIRGCCGVFLCDGAPSHGR